MSIASRSLVIAGALATMLGLFGFVLFASAVTRSPSPSDPRADGIVVLTGGEQRLQAGLALLAERRARRLLISGVHPRTSRDDIRRASGGRAGLFGCCVDIGRQARDTIGNADETRAWSEAHDLSSLIVVTASYHMPRSLAELQRAMPGVRLVPYPVTPRSLAIGPWWVRVESVKVLFAEYVKLLPAYARCQIVRLFEPGDGTQRAHARL
jgi:uncharacterized SAM-binding protein YcdF (DUF218 family)